jgi:hypothetical protein
MIFGLWGYLVRYYSSRHCEFFLGPCLDTSVDPSCELAHLDHIGIDISVSDYALVNAGVG